MEVYTIQNLNFTYPQAKYQALRDISFSVGGGEFITLCGFSGCGKSTLLRHLKTALRPYGEISGNVKFFDKDLDNVPELEQAVKIGFVMQSPDHQSITDKVWHELAFGLEGLGLDNGTIKRKTAEMAAFFGIGSWLYKRIDELSGGQKQILNLAAVMIMQPSVLILDEPTAQLDPIAADEFITMLQKINRELGTTVILSEHSLDRVFSFSDRIIVMDNGKIISDTSPKETAAVLYEKKSGMFAALPAPSQVYTYAEKKPQAAPLTVSEGRQWLSDFVYDKELAELKISETQHDKKEIPMLEIKNLWFRYGKTSDDIIKGVSLKAYKGEIISILGGNGAGKTTLLSTAAGINRPYSGKILLSGSSARKNSSVPKLALLPQNPQALFLKDTVESDLYEIFAGTTTDHAERKRLVEGVIKLCELEKLKDRHPYDLSGGEQQKAALAKILLTKPEILLLDEPVKGLDIRSKQEIGEILKVLADIGMCIIMVSHDMDFSAAYSDRCALFFDGELTGMDEPHRFFSENAFYTTAARRMSYSVLEQTVTVEDILKVLKMGYDFEDSNKKDRYDIEKLLKTEKHEPVKKKKKKISGAAFFRNVSFVTFLMSVFAVLNLFKLPYLSDYMYISCPVMLISAVGIIALGIKAHSKSENIIIRRIHHSAKLTALSIILILAAVPLTIFLGIYFFGDSKYLFISLLIMLECTIPFFAVFENRHIKTREFVLIAVMCALSVTSRALFYMFPQFKPMTAIVIISGAALGAESGFLVGAVSILASNVIFGQGPWTPWQMFTMGIIGFLSGMLFGRNLIPRNKLSFSVFGFLSALIIYGGIMDPAAMIMSHVEPTTESMKAYYLTGLPLDIIHGVSTAIFLYICSEPIIKKIERVKLKYGLIQ
ncbi:MAG: ATP-binding cassette domain-containing protein [Clostridia bacterium]|nr:ATP-binding cassette domain-containing protein [Clostridia bacterium]